MKRAIVGAALALGAASAAAAPHVYSDPLQAGVTHCGIFLDALAKVTIPVTATPTGNICKYDLAPLNLANGPHRVEATAISIDPVWGTRESAKSVPLDFTKPGVPEIPGGVRLAQ